MNMKKLIINCLLVLILISCKKQEEIETKPNRYCRFEITGSADDVKIQYSYFNENSKYFTNTEYKAIQGGWTHSFISKVDNSVDIYLSNSKPLSGNFNVKLKLYVDGILQKEVNSGSNASISITSTIK